MKIIKNANFFTKKVLYILSFLLLSKISFSQSNSTSADVSFVDLPKSIDTFRVIQDSIYFFGTDASSIYGNSYLNAAVGFYAKNSILNTNTIDCYQPFLDTTGIGHLMFFKGSIFEVTKKAKFLGKQVLTFDNASTKQSIYNEQSGGADSFVLTNLQSNNAKGIEVINTHIRIANNLNIPKGKFIMNGNIVEMLGDAEVTCFSPNNYVVLNGDGRFIKSNINKETNIPIGTASTIAMLKVSLNKDVDNFSDHRVSFGVDSFINTDYTQRYDETANLQWKIRNLTSNNKITLDSLKIATTKLYLDKRTKNSNFIGASGFISQFVKDANNIHGGDSSFTQWDVQNLADYKPRLSYSLPYSLATPMVLYSRVVNVDLFNDPLQENLFVLTNFNNTPLGSRIIGTKAFPLDDSCTIHMRWKPSDLYYSKIKYSMYLTNDTVVANRAAYVFQPLNPADIRLDKTELYTQFSLNSLVAKDVVSTKPIFLRIHQFDKYGSEVIGDFTNIPVTCNTKLTDIDALKDIVVYAEKQGETIKLFVEYMANYTEDINFKLYNILGMEEADLGVKTVINKPNKLSFTLPSNITRNQRYILVLFGGILNTNLTRQAISVFIP